MNCKPGDMAIVINAVETPEMIGRIVSVSRLAVNGEIISGYEVDIPCITAWLCHGNNIPMRLSDGNLVFVDARAIADDCLRPIRPSDEQDEMLRIVGLPNKEKEKA